MHNIQELIKNIKESSENNVSKIMLLEIILEPKENHKITVTDSLDIEIIDILKKRGTMTSGEIAKATNQSRYKIIRHLNYLYGCGYLQKKFKNNYSAWGLLK